MIISNLRNIMDREGISVQQLSRRTGLSDETIRMALNGGGQYQMGSCTLLTLDSMAKALGVSIKELFYEF
jgi:transcriptional regulator with XRE-family HTH domain